MWVWLAVGVVVVLLVLVLATRGKADDARQPAFDLADEFQRFLASERPGLNLTRVDLLVPGFRTADGRRVAWLPLVSQVLTRGETTPGQRLAIYRQWADELTAGRIPTGREAPVVEETTADDLETSIRAYLENPGVATQEPFLECLLRSKLFLPSKQPAAPTGNEPWAGLVTDTPEGSFTIAFSSAALCTPEIAQAHGIRSGMLVDAAHALRMVPEGMGLVLNPGHEDLLMLLPAAGLGEFKKARGLLPS